MPTGESGEGRGGRSTNMNRRNKPNGSGRGRKKETDEIVNHPPHYGGDTTYEAIKVIEAWGLNFSLGSALKYICRRGKKAEEIEDLKKARWYIDREIERLESESEIQKR
jgi:hypothetical protein